MPVFALYNFDDTGTGTLVQDSAAANGLQQGLYWNGTTNSGGQVVLDGQNDIVKIFADPTFQLDRGTLNIQFTLADAPLDGVQTVLSRDSVGETDGGYRIEINPDGSVVISHETPTGTETFGTAPGFAHPGDEINLTYSWDQGATGGALQIANLTSAATFDAAVPSTLTMDQGSNSQPWMIGAGQSLSNPSTLNNLNQHFAGTVEVFSLSDTVDNPHVRDGIVTGTSGDDLIDLDYIGDPDGDVVDGNDALIPGDAPNDDRIVAGGGNDTVYAGLGDDSVDGGIDDDLVFGGVGDDTLNGNDGADRLNGGDGNDSAVGGDGDDVIDTSGTSGALPDLGYPGLYPADTNPNNDRDTVFGGIGNDTIRTGDDADLIDGGDGADSINGGFDNDTITGGAGQDTIIGGEGADSIDAGADDDLIYGGLSPEFPDSINIRDDLGDLVTNNGTDLIFGGAGNDTIFGLDDADTIDGGTGNDVIDAGIDNDSVTGGSGDDSVIGGQGDDTISGGAGNDTLAGGEGTDVLTGGIGNDQLDSGDGDDTLDGGAGNDTLTGGSGANAIIGGDGNDSAIGGGGDDVIDTSGNSGARPDLGYPGLYPADTNPTNDLDTVFGGAGNDTIRTGDDADLIDGGDGADSINGGFDNDTITGGAGQDTIIGGEGADSIDAGADDDLIYGGLSPEFPDSINIRDDMGDLVTNNGTDLIFGGAGNDTIFGLDDADTIDGGTGADVIDAGIDNDIVTGGTGNDILTGGQGVDTLSGGDDRDTFIGGNAGDVVDGNEGGDDNDTLDLRGAGPLRVNFGTNPENGTVDFLDADGNVTGSMTFTNIENVIPCFTPGTMIATPKGEVPVESLKAGDRIITRDNGIQEIRWTGQKALNWHDLNANPHMKPILVRQGSLGNGLPERDMMVSPNHRLLVANDRTSLYFDEHEVLVAAKHLVAQSGVLAVESLGTTYIHFMLDRHEVVLSNGAWTESFQPGDYTLKGLGNAQRAEIFELFPELKTEAGMENYTAARKTLKRHEAMLLAR